MAIQPRSRWGLGRVPWPPYHPVCRLVTSGQRDTVGVDTHPTPWRRIRKDSAPWPGWKESRMSAQYGRPLDSDSFFDDPRMMQALDGLQAALDAIRQAPCGKDDWALLDTLQR